MAPTPLPMEINAEKVRAQISLRILPLIFLIYVVDYLDRANVAFAKASISADLYFSEAMFGLGAGIFYLGYLALEIPGALLVELFFPIRARQPSFSGCRR